MCGLCDLCCVEVRRGGGGGRRRGRGRKMDDKIGDGGERYGG